MQTFFTSDTHFGHKNMFLKFNPGTRRVHGHPEPYNDVTQMDEDMIRVWNSRVLPGDDVWHLGDMTFHHSYDRIESILRRLNGRIHFVRGNHDELMIKNEERLIADGLIYSFHDYAELKLDGRKLVMMHFPLAVWNKNHHGAFNLYGHCHGSFKAVGKQMDVGWDTKDLGEDWFPGPIPWYMVKACLDGRPQVAQDHHDGARTDHEGKA